MRWMFARVAMRHRDSVRIAIVDKYSPEFDSYAFLVHALLFSGSVWISSGWMRRHGVQ